MRSYLFHHTALTKWINIFGWNERIYFEIGFTYLGIKATNKAKECL